MIGPWFAIAGGGVFIALGALHGFYTLLDCFNPRRFAPINMALVEEMKNTRVRLRKDARNFWLSYLGFNFSHSLGAFLFGAVAIAIAIVDADLLANGPIAAALIGVALTYALLGRMFWFALPFVLSLIAAALFAGAYVLQKGAI